MKKLVTLACVVVLYLSANLIFAGTVSVTELPQGVHEFVGLSGGNAQVLRLAGDGSLASWADADGNTFLVASAFPAIQVVESGRAFFDDFNKGSQYPQAGEKLEVGAATGDGTELDAAVRGANGFSLTYVVTPQRLGVRVDGHAALYTLRLRYPVVGDSDRIHVGDKVVFVNTNTLCVLTGTQVIADAQRTRALSVAPPEAASIQWQMAHRGDFGYADALFAEVAMKPGQTLWLSTAAVPAYHGPVEVDFHHRRTFQSTGPVVAVGTLSAQRLKPGVPVTLSFGSKIEDILKGGRVVAGLIPTWPVDPVIAGELGLSTEYAYTANDLVGESLLPVEVKQNEKDVTITAPAATPNGAYRLRVWIAPADAPRPEALGGPKGAVAAYFPGYTLNYTPIQDYPIANTFVVVHGESESSLSVTVPDGRRSFWRGEEVRLLVQARDQSPAPGNNVSTRLSIRDAASGVEVATRTLRIPLTDGRGATELSFSTRNLGPGDYQVKLDSGPGPGLELYGCDFTVAPPRTPGMAMVASPMSGPGGVKAYERLGMNVWTDIIPGTGGYAPGWPIPSDTARGIEASDPALPPTVPPGASEYENLVSGNWLWLQGIQPRQLDFYLFHTIPEHVAETYRKHLVYAQFNQRFPSMLGLVFGYDLAGVYPAGSWGAGWETFASAGQKRYALLKTKWAAYWKDAQAHGATAADEGRTHSLFNAHVMGDMYGHSVAELHDFLPEQRHTSSNTLDHGPVEEGMYTPVIYGALDFRYLEVWNDQVYPCSAHDFQEVFWASILRMEKPPTQPMWVTIPTCLQPGTHFRRALNTIARGATGVGYAAEGGAGLTPGPDESLSPWGADPLRNTVRTAEVKLSGDLTTRYGAWLNQFAPNEKVAILYSVSQGGSNFGLQSPTFFMFYALAENNRPARLLTEDQIAKGALSEVDALVLVRQTAPLPPATLAAIEKFATPGSGGKVICDRDTTLAVKGMQKLPDVFMPTTLWPNPTNLFHEIIGKLAGISTPRAWNAAKLLFSYVDPRVFTNAGPPLLAALGDAGRQPLEPINGRAIVSNKIAGDSTLVFVTNENFYPFEDLFTDAQLRSRFLRNFFLFGSVYYKDVRVPRRVTLRLRDDLAAAPPRVYDAFSGRELSFDHDKGGGLTLSVDLATLQGRALLLTPKRVDVPTVWIGRRKESDPLVTVVVRSAVPLPVHIRVGNQEVYRASTAAGSSDTFALGPGSQEASVEVTDLLTGKMRRGTVRFHGPEATPITELSAVEVRDSGHIARVLSAGNLAIYVDPRQADQLEAAKKLAAKISGSEVVFNPKVEGYPVDWDLPSESEASNERIRTQGLLGYRFPLRGYFQWVGPMTPAFVWNRPAIVFGNASNNRLIEDMNSGTLLPRSATAASIGAGRAFIGVAASPFWYNQNVVYALTADDRGTAAALDKLASLAANVSLAPSEQTEASDASPLAERRRQLGFEPLQYPEKLVRLRTESMNASHFNLDPCVPVTGLVAVDGGFLVTLGSPGENLIRLDSHGKVQWRTVTAGFYQPLELRANRAGDLVTRDIGESIYGDGSLTWRHDPSGKPLWKMLGSPVTNVAADGSVWLAAGGLIKRLNANGDLLQTIDPHGNILAVAPDDHVIVIDRPGTAQNLVRLTSAVVAIDPLTGKDLWSVPRCDAMETRLSDDGKLLAVVEKASLVQRDDSAFSKVARLTVIDMATGRVLLRSSAGCPLTNLIISPDDKTVMARETGYSDRVFIATPAEGVLRQVKLPEAGGWAHAFSRDGKSLWVACDRLYRIDVDSLSIHAAPGRRIVQLIATDKGLCAGTSDGRVLGLKDDGGVAWQTELADGIGYDDAPASMAVLRDAKLVDSPALRPHEFPGVVNLAYEFPRNYGGDPMEIRGDGITPPSFAVHAATAGRYRFTMTLRNAPTDGDKIGTFRIVPEEGAEGKMGPINGDKWHQSGTIELKAGTWLITIVPDAWKNGPLLHEIKIEKAD